MAKVEAEFADCPSGWAQLLFREVVSANLGLMGQVFVPPACLVGLEHGQLATSIAMIIGDSQGRKLADKMKSAVGCIMCSSRGSE